MSGATVQTRIWDWRRSRAGGMALGDMERVVGARVGRGIRSQSLYSTAQGSGLIYNQALSIASASGNVGAGLHLEDEQQAGSERRAMRMAAAAGLAACVGAGAGLGDTFRRVVAAVGLVGPAGPAQNFAVAVSSPSPTAN